LQQVGSYPGYTVRDADIVAAAALDPKLTFHWRIRLPIFRRGTGSVGLLHVFGYTRRCQLVGSTIPLGGGGTSE
jgi:hypothetical protein